MNLSPTQVKLFRLCKRKWAFAYIDKIRAPSTVKQDFGTAVHAELERWLSKGVPPSDTPEGKIAKQGIRTGWLPTPGPKLNVETRFELDLPGMVDGVKLIGFIDCEAPPGYEGVAEPLVIDHKTTGDLKWAMKPEELSEDPQAVIYAYRAMRKWKTRRARSRWVYYAATNPPTGPRKPNGARMAEWLFDADTVLWQRTFEKLLNDLAAMRDAHAAWKSADAAPPEPRGCGVYGGCPYALKCNLKSEDVLATAILQDGREHYGLRVLPQYGINGAPDNAAASAPCGAANASEESAMSMTLIEKLKQMKAQTPVVDAQEPLKETAATTPTEPVAEPAQPTPATAKEDERQTLLAKLRAMGDGKAVNPPPDSAPKSAPVESAPEKPAGDGLDGKLKAELAELMQARGVPVPAGWTRARILAWLRANPEGEVAAPDVDEQKPAEKGVVLKATDPEGAKARQEAEANERAEAMHPEAIPMSGLKEALDAQCEEMGVPPPQTGGLIPPIPEAELPRSDQPNPVTGDLVCKEHGFVVMFDAVYAKNETLANGVKHLGDMVKPLADIVAKDNEVEHWGLVEFHRGGPMLAAKFERLLDAFEEQGQPMTGVILADSRTKEAQALRDVLIRRAGVVVQGIA